MASKRAFDEMFIEGTFRTVAEIGIENMRTKHVADYAGFSEATMYRRFPTKEILLRDTFLYLEKQVSNILLQSELIRRPDNAAAESAVYSLWRQVCRYLINHKDETVFLIRYRYSSLYTDDVRKMQQIYSGGLSPFYSALEKRFGEIDHESLSSMISYIFDMSLCFSEEIISGRIPDNENTERCSFLAVQSAVKFWIEQQGSSAADK